MNNLDTAPNNPPSEDIFLPIDRILQQETSEDTATQDKLDAQTLDELGRSERLQQLRLKLSRNKT